MYYLRTGDHAEGFAKFESELLEGMLTTPEKCIEAFKRIITGDLKSFDKAYFKQVETWAKQSPDKWE